MAKALETETEKGKYLCSECQTEFYGKKCPQCGNDKKNLALAPDGIDQELHRTNRVFGSIKDLRTSGEILDPDTVMRDEAVRVQLEEMQGNLRDSYVMKSQIKKKELELEIMRKESALKAEKEALEGKNSPPPQRKGQFGYQDPYYPPGMEQPQSFFPPANAQTAVMSHLMKMNKENRQEFLDSLANADPAAIATLSSLVAPAAQPAYPNPYAMPPWMHPIYAQQAPPQQQQSGPDPMELAVSIINTVSELMKNNQPQGDGGGLLNLYKEQMSDLRSEIKELRNRPPPSASIAELKPVLDDLASIKAQLANGGAGKKDALSSVREITGVIKDLEEMGLVQKPGPSGKSVEEELKLKEFDHKVKMDEKKVELDEKKISAEKVRSEMAKGMLGAMFNRSLEKKAGASDKPVAGNRPTAVVKPVVGQGQVVERPPEIVAEYPVEGAHVYETRAPVKRAATGVI